MAKNPEYTTLWISRKTLEKLENYRTHTRETYDDLINNVINQAELYKSDATSVK